MKKSRWDDSELESLLSQLPKIKDRMDPDDLYTQIQSKTSKRKGIPWKVVSVGIAAVLSLAIITPTFLSNQSATNDEIASEKASDLNQMENSKMLNKEAKETTEDMDGVPENSSNEAGTSNEPLSGITSAGENDSLTHSNKMATAELLFNTDLADASFFTLAIPTKDVQYYVPLTFLMESSPPEKVMERLIHQTKEIREEEFGLSEFLPLEAEFHLKADMKSLDVKLTANHPYKGLEQHFIETIKETFRYSDVEMFTVSVDGETLVEFGDYMLNEPFYIERYPNRAMLLFEAGDSSEALLVPSTIAYESITDALKAMKQGEKFDGINPSIPDDIEVDKVETNGKELVVTLLTAPKLQSDDDQNITAMKAILLVARDFGYETVVFKNESIEKIGEFEMNVPLQTPKAPNVISSLP